MQQSDWKYTLVKNWYQQNDAVPKHIHNEMKDFSFAFTEEEWKLTLVHFDYKCAYCQFRPVQTFDHFIPRNRGGLTSIDNLVPCCIICNNHKRDLLPEEMQFPESTIIKAITKYLHSRRRKTAPLDQYLVTFPRETRYMEKQEFYKNVDEINVRLETLKIHNLDKDEAIQIIGLGVVYAVRKVILGVHKSEVNVFSHCTFECENAAFQIYYFGASKEYAEDYLQTLRTFCIMKSSFIDWKELEK